MPIYAYRCESCGHAKDVLQKISDPLLTLCPACGAEQFKKQVTSAGFQLKGSGWYVTDFRGGASESSKDDAAKADSAKDSGTSSGAEKPGSDKSASPVNAKTGGASTPSTATATATATAPAAPSPAATAPAAQPSK